MTLVFHVCTSLMTDSVRPCFPTGPCTDCVCHSEPQLPPFFGPLHGLPMFSASLRLVPDEQLPPFLGLLHGLPMFSVSLRLVPDEQLPPFLGPLHGLPMFSASLRPVPDEQRRDPACGGCAEISGRVVHAALARPGAEGNAGDLSLGGWEVGLTRPSSEAEFA